MIFATENSNKFQKARFWKEKSVQDVVTLGPTAQGILVLSKLEIKAQMTIKFWALKFEDGNEQKKCRAGAICKGMNVYYGSFNVLLILSKFVAVGFLLLPH